MSNKVNYDEISRFKKYLKDHELVQISNKVSQIEQSLKANNNEQYISATQEYIREIKNLKPEEAEIFKAYF